MNLKPTSLDADHGSIVLGNVAVVVWTGVPRVEVALELERIAEVALEASTNGKMGLLGVLEGTHVPPSSEFRAVSNAVNERLVNRGAVGLASIIPVSGFKGALFRSVVTGLAFMSRTPYPIRFFEHSADGAHWLARLGCDVPEQLAEQVDAFRVIARDAHHASER